MGAWDAAQANTALKYDPQQAAIQRQIDANPGATAATEASLQGYGTAGRGIIGQNYNTLYGLLDQNRAQQGAAIAQGAANTERGWNQADAAIQTQGQDSRNYLQQIMDRTGQTGALGSLKTSSALEDLIGQQVGRNSVARAGTMGNMRDWGAQQDVFAGQGITAAHSGEAMDRSDFESQLLGLLGENKLTGTKAMNELQGKFSDVLGSRQNDLIASYEQLAQQEWENSFKQAQLDSSNANSAADRSASSANSAAGRQLQRELAAKEGAFDPAAWMQQQSDNAYRDREQGLKYRDPKATPLTRAQELELGATLGLDMTDPKRYGTNKKGETVVDPNGISSSEQLQLLLSGPGNFSTGASGSGAGTKLPTTTGTNSSGRPISTPGQINPNAPFSKPTTPSLNTLPGYWAGVKQDWNSLPSWATRMPW